MRHFFSVIRSNLNGKDVDLLVWISSNGALSNLYQLENMEDVNTIIDLVIQRIQMKWLKKYILPLYIILGYDQRQYTLAVFAPRRQ